MVCSYLIFQRIQLYGFPGTKNWLFIYVNRSLMLSKMLKQSGQFQIILNKFCEESQPFYHSFLIQCLLQLQLRNASFMHFYTYNQSPHTKYHCLKNPLRCINVRMCNCMKTFPLLNSSICRLKPYLFNSLGN